MKVLTFMAGALVCAGCVTSETSSRAVSEISTEELCRLRVVEGNFDTVVVELERRGEFSDEDLLQIRRRAIVPGMSDAAVRCSYGAPQQVVRNSPGEDFDTVYIYGLETRGSRRLGETRVYLADGRVVRRDDSPTIVN